MASAASPVALPWYANFLCAGLGACTAELATLPIDAAKVRLQLLNRAAAGAANSGNAAAAGPKPPGMLTLLRKVAAEDGFTALYRGFWPAMHRQLLFASLRVGLYGQISAYFRKPGETTVSLGTKVLSGLVAGAIGISIATPTDLVKVRFQSDFRVPGQPYRYNGVWAAYTSIARSEGITGLWTGLGPNIFRNSIINASELASYDTAKEVLLGRMGLPDGLPVHFASATFAGAMATLLGNPVDVVKTRVMAAKKAVAAGAAAGGPKPYTGAVDCIVRTLREEGPRAFYQGVTPQFFRITGWNIVMFVTFEQLKAAAGRMVAQQQQQPGAGR